jgi:hypothetical protein
MPTIGRLVERKQIIEAVRQMAMSSGIPADKAGQKKVLTDSLLSTIAMADLMGFSRNDVILALKDEWLNYKHLKEAGNDGK